MFSVLSLLNLDRCIDCTDYVTRVQLSDGRRHMAAHYDVRDGQWRTSECSLKCRFDCVMFSNYTRISYQIKHLMFNHSIFLT